MRINHKPIVAEIQLSTVQYSTNAAVFIVVFQVYVNYFILKFYKNEFDERGKKTDLPRISANYSLVLNFSKEVEHALQLRPCKILFMSLAV